MTSGRLTASWKSAIPEEIGAAAVTGDPIAGAVVAITGASSGIGEATASAGSAGAKLVLGARRVERLDQIAAELVAGGAGVVTLAVDVTRPADLDALVAGATDRFGRLDVLVSNAGISKIGRLSDGDVAGWSAMIDVNLRGVLHGIAAAAPVFRRQGHGHFVTTVSTAGLKIVPDMGVYAGTKNAVRTVMEALRQESTDGVIRTTSISPGFVRTELDSSIDDPVLRAQIRSNMDEFGLPRRRWRAPWHSRSSSLVRSRSAKSSSGPRFRADVAHVTRLMPRRSIQL